MRSASRMAMGFILLCFLSPQISGIASGQTASPAGLVLKKAMTAKLAGRYDEAFLLLSREILSNPSNSSSLRNDLYLRLIDSFQDKLADRKGYEDFLGKASKTSDLAVLYLRGLYYIRADLEAMAGQRSRLSIVTNFLAIAPFDNEDGRGHENVYPPEAELIFTNSYVGKARKVSWRRIFSNPFGRIKADNFFRPYKEATGYFCVFLKSDSVQSGYVRLAVNTPFKLWINGTPAGADDAKHPFVLDQYPLPLTLREGWNVLLLKSSVPDQEEWKFLLRLSGFPSAIDQSVDPSVLGQASPEPAEAALPLKPADPLRAALEDATNSADKAARQSSLFEYACYRYFLQDYDTIDNFGGRLFQRLADEYHDDPLYAFMAGVSHSQYRFQKKYLERSLELSPGSIEAAVQLVNYYYTLGRAAEMFGILDSIPAETRPFSLSLFLCQYHLGKSDPVKAMETLNGLKPVPTAAYWSLRAGVNDALFSAVSAATDLRKAFDFDRTDPDVRERLVDVYGRQGDVPSALSVIDSAFVLYPDSIELLEKKADLLVSQKRYSEALAELAGAEAICPEDALLLEKTGDAWFAASVKSNGRRYYRASLAVKPNNNRLKEHLAFLFPSTNALTLFSRPIEDVWRRGSEQPETTILLNQEVSEVYRDGTYSTLAHFVIQLVNDSDLEEFTEQNLFYSPDQERLDLLKARVYEKDMSYREIDDVADFAYGGENASLFYNLRYRHIAFPKLRKGAVVEIEYVRYNFSANDLGANYFGTSFSLQDRYPVKLDLFTIIADEGVKIYSGFENLGRPDAVQTVPGKWRNRTVTAWSATNMPKIEQEMWAPAFGSLSAAIVVSTMKDWKEFGVWLSALYKDQLVSDDSVRQTVKAVIAGAATTAEKIRRIWEFCASQVRYVGLELGIGGIRPRPVGTTLSSGFGDCKDKASLLSAMLAEAGIKSSVCLVRTSGKGGYSYNIPYLGAFDHAICQITESSGDGMLLDGTADFYTFDVLPCQDRVDRVLVLDAGQTRFVKVPPDSSDRNKNTVRSSVAIASDGSAVMTRSIYKTGNFSPRFRYDFYAVDKRQRKLEEYWNQWFQGATVGDISFSGLSDLSVEPMGSYTVNLPRFVEEQNSRIFVKAGVGKSDYVLQYAADARPRHYDLELPFPFRTEEETVFVFPRGLVPERIPASVREENDFVSVERAVRQEGNSLVLKFVIVFKVRIVPRARYAEFRSMMNRLNAIQDEKIFLRREQ